MLSDNPSPHLQQELSEEQLAPARKLQQFGGFGFLPFLRGPPPPPPPPPSPSPPAPDDGASQQALANLAAALQPRSPAPPSPSPSPSPSPTPSSSPSPSPSPSPAPAPLAEVALLEVAGVPSPSPSAPAPAPSVQSTGPRFSPAPVAFSSASLPTYAALPAAPGPASASAVAAAAPPGQCRTIGEVLASISEASQWLQLLKNAGLEPVLLSDQNVQVTLLVPVNSAFSAGVDARPLRQEKTMQELVVSAPELGAPLAGYSVVRGLWPSGALQPGASLPTATTLDKVNPLTIAVGGGLRLVGIGSSASILQKDLAACGPSVVHIIDQILLPFSFDQGPTDAVAGTQVPGAARPAYTNAPAAAAAGRR